MRFKTSKDARPEGTRAYTVFWISAMLAISVIFGATAIILLDMERDRSRRIPLERGNLSQVIGEIVGGMPGRGTEGYVKPSSHEASEFADLASAMSADDLEEASRSADFLDYTLVWYEDIPTGRRLLMAREEEVPARTAKRGWGTIVVDPGGTDLIVEVPHPLFDIDTPEVGVELFEQTGAKALLLAGTHRYSWADGRADVAHATGTPFDAAHKALLAARFVVQPHGFHAREDDRYPDIVLSAGVAPAPIGIRSVYRSMNSAGIDIGLFDGRGRYKDLAGTRNLQGTSTREVGGEFVHVELAWHVRTNPVERSRVVETLARALARSAELGHHLS
jgi:hypothetical protein